MKNNDYITVDELIEILKQFPGDSKVSTSNVICGPLKHSRHKLVFNSNEILGDFVSIVKKEDKWQD